MKLHLLLRPLAFAFVTIASAATFTPDLAAHRDSSVWRIHNRTSSAVPGQPQALRLDARDRDGVAWLVGSSSATRKSPASSSTLSPTAPPANSASGSATPSLATSQT